jgi:hypothetical protein
MGILQAKASGDYSSFLPTVYTLGNGTNKELLCHIVAQNIGYRRVFLNKLWSCRPRMISGPKYMESTLD